MSPSSRHSFSLIQFTNCSYRERYSVDGLHYFTSTCFFESLITSWNFKYMIPQRSSLQGQEFNFFISESRFLFPIFHDCSVVVLCYDVTILIVPINTEIKFNKIKTSFIIILHLCFTMYCTWNHNKLNTS